MLKERLRPWRAVYQSFYRGSIYREAAWSWRGLAYQYLIILLLFLWIVAGLHLQLVVASYIDGFLIPFFDDMPRFDHKNGTLTMDKPGEVYQVKDRRNGRVLVDFDLRKVPRDPPLSEDGIFYRRTALILHHEGKEEISPFKERDEPESTKQKEPTDTKGKENEWSSAKFVLERVKNFFALFVVGSLWIASFLLCAVQSLVYAFIGKLLAVLNRVTLTYAQLVRIAIVAMTPTLLIDTVQKLTCTGIPAWALVSFVLSLAYLLFGVRANAVARLAETEQSLK